MIGACDTAQPYGAFIYGGQMRTKIFRAKLPRETTGTFRDARSLRETLHAREFPLFMHHPLTPELILPRNSIPPSETDTLLHTQAPACRHSHAQQLSFHLRERNLVLPRNSLPERNLVLPRNSTSPSETTTGCPSKICMPYLIRAAWYVNEFRTVFFHTSLIFVRGSDASSSEPSSAVRHFPTFGLAIDHLDHEGLGGCKVLSYWYTQCVSNHPILTSLRRHIARTFVSSA